MIKHKAREFFKDLLKSGFITQLPVQQPRLQLPDMSAFNNSVQPCYLTALRVHTKLSVWESIKQVTVPRCAWAVKAAGVEFRVEILLQQLLWLDLGNNFKCRSENAAVNAFTCLLLEEQPNVIFHEVRLCSHVANTLDTWCYTVMPSSRLSASLSTSDKVIVVVGSVLTFPPNTH